MSRLMTDEDLVSLAVEADERNRTLGIVGVLFVARNCFLQVLEGARTPVRWLYSEIERDPRQVRMTKLLDAPIERRAFAGWSMRLLCETDLSGDSRSSVLEAIGSARFLQADEAPAPSELTALLACPSIFARGAFGRDIRGREPEIALARDARAVSATAGR